MENVSIGIAGRKILGGFSLRLFPGEKITLIGRSGCGKSTLLRSLLGFVIPESGRIRIFGVELTGQSVWKLRTRMAYVAQEPEMGAGGVRGLLERPFSFKSNRHLRGNLARLPELMERLHLPESVLDTDIADLSGGEKQRVALISGLLLDREILLLDEASSALDQAAKSTVIELLGSIEALTVLSVSHDEEWIGFSGKFVDLSDVQYCDVV